MSNEKCDEKCSEATNCREVAARALIVLGEALGLLEQVAGAEPEHPQADAESGLGNLAQLRRTLDELLSLTGDVREAAQEIREGV